MGVPRLSIIVYVLATLLWLGAASLPDTTARRWVEILLAAGVSLCFLWVIGALVRKATDDELPHWPQVIVAAVLMAAQLASFAYVHSRIGILDNRSSGAVEVSDYGSCFYFSVVTFTTLGYGDYYPTEQGRVIAAIQAMLGFITLGVAASTAASMLKNTK